MIPMTISPTMQNQELWNHWTGLRNLRRKYLTFNNEVFQITLSQEAVELVAQRRRAKVRLNFNKYLDTHREAYNKIYRERYHILKARKAEESQEDDELVIEVEI
jgi:GTP cyclohydrolase FolE2